MIRRVVNFMHDLLPEFYLGEDSMDSGPISNGADGPADDDDEPPQPAGSRPVCRLCGGPNYSPYGNDRCIACRLFLRPL